ncbi:MAG: DMT family transporter [Deltaproteobacteria bacterium]|nr:MAG: DMT family transporter [Deltaproteobacteria bacterium]
MEKRQQKTGNPEPSFLATLAIIGICTTFGANTVFVKITLSGMGAFTTAGSRFFIASMTITLWALLTKRSILIKKTQIKEMLILSVIFICQLGLFNLGLSLTYASRGSLIINLQPFFVLILAHFFIPGDSFTSKKLVGILLGFAGVTIMFLQKDGISSDLRSGDFLMLASVFLWAINAIYTKKIISGFKPFQLVLYPGILSVPFFFLAGYLWDTQMFGTINLKVFGSLLYQSLITASFGFVVWINMLQKYGAVTLHSYIFIIPISGVLLGGFLLDEPVGTVNIILASLLIAAGIVIVHSDFSFVRRRLGW